MSVLLHPADESNAFRERDGVRKGLREGAVTRKLEDSVLRKLVRAVDALIVVEPGAGSREHVIDVVGVRRVVRDLQSYVAIRPVVSLLPALVARRDKREEVEDVRRPHVVFEETAVVGLPFPL